MIQTSSVTNFYNLRSACFYHKKSKQFLWNFSLRNFSLQLVSDPINRKDFLNFFTTGYRLTTHTPKAYIQAKLISWFLVQWAKLAFRGKSFRVRNFCRNNKFTFNFGYSHWTKLKLTRQWSFFKRRRQRYLIFTFFFKDFCFFKRFFPHIKRYNCYTMRGLRFRKQAIIRRFGKISQHISILH